MTGGADRGVLAQWAELGRIFRAMGRLAKGAATDHDAADPRFQKLRQEMGDLLDRMEASPELRALCVERSRHIFHNELGAVLTCYAYSGPVFPEVGKDVFTRAKELERLVAEGRLTDDAARKAARYLAIDAEYATGACKVARRADNETPWDDATVERIHREYDEQQLRPAADAVLAGNRVVEMATDQLGMLAELPAAPEAAPKGSEAK
jgi:hypothetical protein